MIIQQGLNIFDLANQTGYGIDYVYKLIKENPFITSIDYDFTANPGYELVYDTTFVKKKPQILTQNVSKAVSDVRESKCVADQSIFDICLQTYGDLNQLFKLIKENEIDSINEANFLGKSVKFTFSNVSDIGFFNMLSNNKIKIATSETKDSSINFLLQESGFHLLLEDGSKIIL